MGRPAGSRGSRGSRDRSVKTVDRKPIRPLERQRMRPWLIQVLDEGHCSQVSWLNRKEKKFRVAWKHAAGQNWNMGLDASLFEKWARHTGKFYDGDKPNPKKWKANFRCALNSLPDVEHEPSLGIKRGLNAFKVYRFLDEKKKKLKPKPKVSREVEYGEEEEEEEDDDFCDDGEDEMFKRLQMRCRSRRQRMELDSEGSEIGASPSHESSVDFERSEKLEPEIDHEYNASKSPLPHFDQICPFQFKEHLRTSFSETRFPEAPSPQHISSDDDEISTTSSAPTDQEVVEMLLEDDVDFPYSHGVWTSPFLMGVTDSQATDGLVFFDSVQDGPSVVVQSENTTRQQDWVFTSLKEL